MGTKERNRTIDILKGISIVMVILTHYEYYPKGAREQFLFPFWVVMAVPIFMILSGYVNAESYLKKNADSFKAVYNGRGIVKKLIRFTLPFAMAYVVEHLLIIFVNGKAPPTIQYLLITFVRGGLGKGSYYFPMLIQMIFVFPLIYLLVKKLKAKGLVLCGLANLAYELFKYAVEMEPRVYRILIFRYILALAFGCYAAVEKNIRRKWIWIIVSLVGAAYIILTDYINFIPLITIWWHGTSLWACMFIAPVVMWLVRRNPWRFRFAEEIGKASYNILFVQMLYYHSLSNYVYQISTNIFVHLLLNIVICVGLGYLFYRFENPLTTKVIKKATDVSFREKMC